ncbi:MAG: ATP-binding cassette domain-containing protein [Anaerolineae bacterium]
MSCFLSIASISKTFGTKTAVADLSFTVESGEIFGLLGPNGAGKTTTLRMILGLLKPDVGEIQIFGKSIDEHNRDRIGYMPEERGLYNGMRLIDCLVYLGTLKNLSRSQALIRAERDLKEFDLWQDRRKKIGQLSRGMLQKAQIIAATLHEPALLIVDEPFANLDPINVQFMQNKLRGMRERGESVILSSHQLHLVESLCDRILLIDRGKAIIYGPLREIQQKFTKNQVRITGEGAFERLPGVAFASHHGLEWELTLVENTTPADLFRILSSQPDIRVTKFEVELPSLDEIFIQTVSRRSTDA